MSSKRAPPLPQLVLDDLSDELLLRILCCLPAAQRPSLPLVCRRWRAVCEGASLLWEELHVNFCRMFNSSYLYKWLLPRRQCVRALTVVTEQEDNWLALHLVLGLVAAGLERLVVRAGREGLGMASMDWLGVLTRLRSLHMDFDRDFLIAEATFPPGLEELVLRPVGGWAMLKTVPPGLASATALTSLQRLAVTSSHLACLPGGMTALTRLSSLDMSDSAGSPCLVDPEGLAPLTALKGLALLNLSKCGLEGLPAEVATLPALHTLLLSGNQLRDLPQEGSYLAYLESVDLSLNKLDALPPALLGCSRLEAVDLSGAVERLESQYLRQLLTANPHIRLLSIGTAALPTSQLAKLQAAFPLVRVAEVDPSASRPHAGVEGAAAGSSEDEEWEGEEQEWDEEEEDEEWEGEEESGSADGGSGMEDGGEEDAELDDPGSSAEELDEDEEDE
ncbi:hypothetical protein COHA_005843 [Chlorella ohadii]|uniref:F-box domain-containing protein n=1 Tax=Chlorella ohadii TaxID=2649997 RepID=A0AAD5H5T0_9CHLO|nr:hypothetical protein COHA_005843 [Chlorella ohadii]